MNLKALVVSFGCVALFMATGAMAQPQGLFGDTFLGTGLGYTASGTMRLDTTLSMTDEKNISNQFGDPYNDFGPFTRTPGNPGLPVMGIPIVEDLVRQGVEPFSVDIPFADQFTSSQEDRDKGDFNYHVLRFDGELDISLAEGWRFVGRIRALHTLGNYENEFHGSNYTLPTGLNGTQATLGAPENPELYLGDPNNFEYQVVDDESPLFLEWADEEYFVDLPAFLVEWTNGATTARLGRMQIAWGKTLFFRIIDKANALDLRRHLILDRALEEFADERVPALSLRVTHQINNNILVDSYLKRFTPRILPNPNTPYNVVPSQFTIEDRYHSGGYDDKLDFGVRVRGDYGDWGWQVAYFHRYNPAGYFSWTESGVPNDFKSDSVLGGVFNNYCVTVLASQTDGCGSILARTPFSVAPEETAVNFGEQFTYFGQRVRLNAFDAVNAAVTDFPAAKQLLARTIPDYDNLIRELSAFFIASPLRGHIDREYAREDVFGGGLTYVTNFGNVSSASFWNQIVINLEAAYTPDKTFTPLGIEQEPIVEDEFEVALVVEKYYRVIPSWPSTFMVFQLLHRTTSDIFDRHLSGFGTDATSLVTDAEDIDPPGRSSVQYIALAALQPSDLFIHEFSIAMLLETEGGVLIQPGYKYKPSGAVTIELFYTYIDGDTFGDTITDSTVSTVSFADELTLRLTYAF